MQVLYESWLSAEEEWSSSKLVVTLRNSSKLSSFGCRKWFTRADLLAKYNNDEDIVTEIIHEKEKVPEAIRKSLVRPHPDAPLNKQLTQYLCFHEDGESEEHDSVLSSLFSAVSKKKTKKDKKDKRKKRKRSTSSSSTSTRSESESSGSSSNDKKKKKKKKSKKDRKDSKGSKKEKTSKKKETEKQKAAREKKELKDKEKEAEKENNKIRSAANKVTSVWVLVEFRDGPLGPDHY